MLGKIYDTFEKMNKIPDDQDKLKPIELVNLLKGVFSFYLVGITITFMIIIFESFSDKLKM